VWVGPERFDSRVLLRVEPFWVAYRVSVVLLQYTRGDSTLDTGVSGDKGLEIMSWSIKHGGMDADEIRDYSQRYDEGYSEEHDKIEQKVHDVLDNEGRLTQDDLAEVVRWKLDNQPGRRDRYIEMMRSTPDEFVQHVTEAALLADESKVQLQTLSSIPGIGDATATVVLAFYDPTTYAVGDRYIIDALFEEDRGFRRTDYPDLLEKLRERNPDDFDLRTVEKAYYRRYQEENDIV
jgi:hypothetical protein